MPSKPLILVADDEPSMLELVGRHLQELEDPSVDVLEASDGEEALSLAQEHLPDLVVLDVMMPGMSGWEVCKKIREDAGRFAHTGVIMLTGIGENLNHMTSPLYGADFYIDKPFDFGELDKKVRQALRDRASQRAGVSRPPTNGVHGAAKALAPRKTTSAKKPVPAKKPVKLVTKAAAKKLSVKKAAKKKPLLKEPRLAKRSTPAKRPTTAAKKSKTSATKARKTKPAKKRR